MKLRTSKHNHGWGFFLNNHQLKKRIILILGDKTKGWYRGLPNRIIGTKGILLIVVLQNPCSWWLLTLLFVGKNMGVFSCFLSTKVFPPSRRIPFFLLFGCPFSIMGNLRTKSFRRRWHLIYIYTYVNSIWVQVDWNNEIAKTKPIINIVLHIRPRI